MENGRLKGQKLDSGSFLSPEVSFDGKTILFAYSECKAEKTYQWAPEYSYHIFKVNADGTGLGPVDRRAGRRLRSVLLAERAKRVTHSNIAENLHLTFMICFLFVRNYSRTF